MKIMSWRRIKRRQSDIEFSKFIRARAGWICQRCGRRFEEGAANLHNSHYWLRGHENTRFDPENCDALCASCHAYAETHEGHDAWYKPFKIAQLGQQAYDLLEMRHHQYKKRDDFMDLILVRDRANNQDITFIPE